MTPGQPRALDGAHELGEGRPIAPAHLPGGFDAKAATSGAVGARVHPAELEPVPEGALCVPAAGTLGEERVRLSVVIPTRNESASIVSLVGELVHLLRGPSRGSLEIIVVDDDSPDETWRVAMAAKADFPELRVMRRVGERGLATAVIRGWQIARGDVLGVIDGDLQHPPDVSAHLYERIERGADLAIGSRHTEGGGVSIWSAHRRVLSRGAQLLGLMVLPKVVGRVSDPMSGYFMVKRQAVADRPMSPLGYKVLVEVLARADLRRIDEVGYVFRERAEGESKVTWQIYVDYVQHLARLRFGCS